MAIGDEFDELMLHRITVTSFAGKDKYGRDTVGSNSRVYKCLLTVRETKTSNAGGVNISMQNVAYIKAIPIGGTVPVDIDEKDQIIVTSPANWPQRPLASISRNYDTDGTLHNIEVGFS